MKKIGPTYCGDGCISNCDAHAQCGQHSITGKQECPLRVCCSKYWYVKFITSMHSI